MIKKEIYPKTKRLPNDGTTVCITEKCDGSNLAIFKLDSTLYIAQRKNIYDLAEAMQAGKSLYPGLYDFLDKHGIWLYENLYEGSAICGEWLGMGKLKYDWDKEFGSRYLMFAKARVSEDFRLENIQYNHDGFGWIFTGAGGDPVRPDFIAEVPIVANVHFLPDKASLDNLYASYADKVGRPVEGFVCEYNNSVMKYVRMHNGQLVDYDENTHKGE